MFKIDLDWLKPLVNLKSLFISGLGFITNTDGLLSLTKLVHFYVHETYIHNLTTYRNNLNLEKMNIRENVCLSHNVDDLLDIQYNIKELESCRKMKRFVCDNCVEFDVIKSWKNLNYLEIKSMNVDFSQTDFPYLNSLKMYSCDIFNMNHLSAPNLEQINIRESRFDDHVNLSFKAYPKLGINNIERLRLIPC